MGYGYFQVIHFFSVPNFPRPYIYSSNSLFCRIFQALRLFPALGLFRTLEYSSIILEKYQADKLNFLLTPKTLDCLTWKKKNKIVFDIYFRTDRIKIHIIVFHISTIFHSSFSSNLSRLIKKDKENYGHSACYSVFQSRLQKHFKVVPKL